MGAYRDDDVLVQHFVDVPRRRWKVVVVGVVVGVILGLAYLKFGASAYTASTTVRLNAFSTRVFETDRPVSQLLDIPGELELAQSRTVASSVADMVGGDPREIRRNLDPAGVSGDTTLTMSYSATTPARATEVANSASAAYLQYRAEIASERQKSALSNIEFSLEALREQLAGASAERADAQPGTAAATDAKSAATVLIAQIADLNQRQNELSSMVLSPGQVVNAASPESAEVKPGRSTLLAGGGLVGFVAGLGLAFVRERSNRRTGNAGDVTQSLDAPVLASMTGRSFTEEIEQEDLSQMRLLRAELLGRVGHTPFRLLLVDPGAQQSSVMAGYLAGALAVSGLPVTLLTIGADRQALTRLAAAARVTSGSASQVDVEVTELFASLSPEQLSDAVEFPVVDHAVDRRRAAGRVVVLCPAMTLERAELMTLSRRVDRVLVVVDTRSTRTHRLQDLARDVRSVGADIVGAVIATAPTRRGRARRAPASVQETGGQEKDMDVAGSSAPKKLRSRTGSNRP